MEMVRRLVRKGWLVGSCSDRTVTFQKQMWESQGIIPEFTVLKHKLEDVKRIFPFEEYYHVGDTDVDRMYSERNGFVFVESGLAESWMSGL